MIVRCPNCQTEFSLDDRQVGADGATVRCSVCAYVFKVHPAAGVAADQPWQIRTADDLLFSAPDLGTLKRWIDEQRLHPDDEVSRTGKHWLRLGDMPEFADAFAAKYGELDGVGPGVVRTVQAARGPAEASDVGPPPDFGTEITSRSSERSARPGSPAASMLQAVTQSVGSPATAETRVTAVRVSAPMMAEVRVAASPPPPPGGPAGAGASARAVAAASAATSGVSAGTAAAGPASASPAAATAARTAAAPVGSAPAPAAAAASRTPDAAPDRGAAAAASFAGFSTTGLAERDGADGSRSTLIRRRRAWPWVAAIAIASGVGVTFGVPAVRERVLGLAQSLVGAPAQAPTALPTEVAAAERAAATLDPVAMGRAEAELQARIDEGVAAPAVLAAMRLVQVELLATRAVERRIAAVLAEGAARSAAEAEAGQFAERASRTFDAIGLDDVVDRDRLKRARAQLRLAEGRPPAEIQPLLPADAEALAAVVAAAPLWQSADAEAPAEALDRLARSAQLDGLGRLVLALGSWRAGRPDGARGQVEAILVAAPEQPTALALRDRLAPGADAAAGTDTGDAAGGPGDEATGTGAGATSAADAAASLGTGAEPPTPPAVASARRDAETQAAAANLADAGCRKVEAGDADGGVKLLLRAFDRNPRDLDVLVCLGQGYAKQGNLGSAEAWYKRALQQSPRNAPALAGAAGVAERQGRTAAALWLYEELLSVRPGDAKAAAFVAKHKASAAPDPASGGGGGAPPKSPPSADSVPAKPPAAPAAPADASGAPATPPAG